MEIVIYILLTIFLLIGVLLILQALGKFKKFDKHHANPYNSKNPPETISAHLTILNGSFDETTKSDAVISLMNNSYFYVQVQGNEGNNYDDKIQTAKFDQLLSKTAVLDLKRLEGKNGQYSF